MTPQAPIQTVSVQIDVPSFGRALAHASSMEQAAVINFMAHELRVSIGKDSDLEMQLCHISGSLDSNGTQLIETLADFLRVRREHTPGQERKAVDA